MFVREQLSTLWWVIEEGLSKEMPCLVNQLYLTVYPTFTTLPGKYQETFVDWKNKSGGLDRWLTSRLGRLHLIPHWPGFSGPMADMSWAYKDGGSSWIWGFPSLSQPCCEHRWEGVLGLCIWEIDTIKLSIFILSLSCNVVTRERTL